jgi:hypothetical protein
LRQIGQVASSFLSSNHNISIQIIVQCPHFQHKNMAGLVEDELQVSLAIRGGYVPEKFGIREYQNHQFMNKLG